MKLALLLAFLVLPACMLGQGSRGGSIEGQVTDSSGAVLPGAVVTITSARGDARKVATGETGSYAVTGLAPGRYTVRAASTDLAPYENTAVEVSAGRVTRLPISLSLQVERQQITVEGQDAPAVSTEASDNATAIVLRAEDLAAFSDDPDELAIELQALAGPAAGPNGGQLFVDGFTAGRLPPKSSIREIRINHNPLSAEFEHLGFGRIEVITKPGAEKFRGETFFDLTGSSISARNPFAPTRLPFQQRFYGGNLGGPLNKRSSYFFEAERREVDDDAIVNATVLDAASLQPLPFTKTVQTPSRLTSLGPRVDYQLNQTNTFTARYRFTRIGQSNAGVSTFSLPSRAYDSAVDEQVAQFSDTAVLSAHAINETRFQFRRTRTGLTGADNSPAIDVLGVFSGGGAQVGRSSNAQNNWEIQNYSTLSAGVHSLRFGVRLRAVTVNDISPRNFAGSFTFSGGGWGPALDAAGNIIPGAPLAAIDPLESYRRTLLAVRLGLSSAAMRELGGGASLFTLSAGDPQAGVSQVDLGAFLQEDWRIHPNFTLNLGLRYETQTNIHDWTNFAPRLGFAWAPGRDPKKRKLVLRGGFGIFYSRFGENLTLQTVRFNGLNQQQYIIANPDFFSQVPPAESLTAGRSPVAVWRAAADARAPYLTQWVISAERQLPLHTTIATIVTYSRGEHLLLARNINAPLPGGMRPYGPGDIFQYESGGIYRQISTNTTLTNHIGKRLSLFGMYGYVVTHSDTDGPSTQPADSYNRAAEFGRSLQDMRHHFEAGGSFTAFRGIRFSPLFNGRSGLPFNITTGRDLNGDGLFTDRPAFATDPSRPGVVATPYGLLDPNPAPGARIIPRNYGEGPAYVILNLRVSRTFSFGGGKKQAAAGDPESGFQAVFGEAPTGRRYALTVSAHAHNLLNQVNAAQPVGVLTSPLFLRSQALASYWGPAGEAANRRVTLQLRFSF